MKRTRFFVLACGLIGMAAFAANAWTQDDSPRKVDANARDALSADKAVDSQRAPGAAAGVRSDAPARIDAVGARPPEGVNFYRTDVRSVAPIRSRTVARTVYDVVTESLSAEEIEELQAFQKARETLKDSKDEAERQKASDVIRKHLEKQFERDLTQREQDLVAIEERLKTLRQQLAKRKTAKDDIVSLRLKTIMNDADGLGFPGEEGLHDRNLGDAVYSRSTGVLRATPANMPLPGAGAGPRRP